jgi:hypothetical protein
MKHFFWLLPLAIILSACPFESNMPLEQKPALAIDTSLNGYWYGIVKDGSDFFGIEALDIKSKTDSLYSIIRYGKSIKGDMILPDTAYFTGFLTNLNGEPYMNVVADVVVTERDKKGKIQVKNQTVYYIGQVKQQNDTLSVKMVTEDFTKRKFYKSPEEFKQTVVGYLHENKNIFDDQYNLSYKRIRKP